MDWVGNAPLIGFGIASLLYAVGLVLSRLPLPGEGKSWGGSLISYSLLTAAFLAVVGAGQALTSLAESVSNTVVSSNPSFPRIPLADLPDKYFTLGHKAMWILAIMAGTVAGTALIPIIGPPLASVMSVFSTLPSMALTGVTILSFIVAVTLMVFTKLSPVMIPVGVILLSTKKLKGLGGWFIAMSLAVTAVGPLIPVVGVTACNWEGVVCTADEVFNPGNFPQATLDSFIMFLKTKDNLVTKMWAFTLGSSIGLGILSVAAAALSRGIGGVAANLGIG